MEKSTDRDRYLAQMRESIAEDGETRVAYVVAAGYIRGIRDLDYHSPEHRLAMIGEVLEALDVASQPHRYPVVAS